MQSDVGSPAGRTRRESSTDLGVRLSRASVKKLWNVFGDIDWPDSVDPEATWFLSPELVSLHGTRLWDDLDEPARRRLSFFELVNFFSLTLHGERPLVQGLCNQMYARRNAEVTRYIHHFLDEENKHMIMFGEFCTRYAGRVYPQKKIAIPRDYVRGEEDVTFFIKVLIIEELGDYYNVFMQRDDRIAPIAREVNRIHHQDEARHIIFGRQLLRELWEEHTPGWEPKTLDGLRAWLCDYLRSSWGDFYNPSMYQDAGLAGGYEVRKSAMADPISREHRVRVSRKLVDYFLDVGILLEEPPL